MNTKRVTLIVTIGLAALVLFFVVLGIIQNAQEDTKSTEIASTRTATSSPEPPLDPTLTPTRSPYIVLVQDRASGNLIVRAEVIIELSGTKAAVNAFTDNTGHARLFINQDFIGKPGRLLVNATEYQPYVREMDIFQEELPARILLDNVSPVVTPTEPELTPTISNTPGKVIFQPDFSGLELQDYECGRFEYLAEDDAYHIQAKCLHARSTSDFTTEYLLDFDYRVKTRKVSGSNRGFYGIILLAEQEGKSYEHRVMISGIGNFTYEVVEILEDGDDVNLNIIIPAEYDPAIRTGDNSNELLIQRRGSFIELFVNGKRVMIEKAFIDLEQEVTTGIIVITQNDDMGGDDLLEVAFKDVVISEPQ